MMFGSINASSFHIKSQLSLIIFFVKVCDEALTIFRERYMTHLNINIKFHFWDFRVAVVA